MKKYLAMILCLISFERADGFYPAEEVLHRADSHRRHSYDRKLNKRLCEEYLERYDWDDIIEYYVDLDGKNKLRRDINLE